jgi:hypothetical protein
MLTLWVLQGMQHSAVTWFEEVDPLDGLAVDLARLGHAVECANSGGEVIEGREVSQISSVAAKENRTEIGAGITHRTTRAVLMTRRFDGLPPLRIGGGLASDTIELQL